MKNQQNEQVTQALDRISSSISSRESNKNLAKLLNSISRDCPVLKYDQSMIQSGLVCSFILIAISVLALNLGAVALAVLLSAGCAFIYFTYLFISQNMRHSSVTEELQKLYEVNLMNLYEYEFDPEEKAEELASCYFEFQRGNYHREVTSCSSGVVRGKTKEIEYELFQFHWVDEHTVQRTYTDENGKTKTKVEKVYIDHYRTAVLTNIDLSIDAYIYNYGGISRGVSWHSSSPGFNRHFKVYGETEMALARLLKPAVVLLLEDLADEFAGLNFEFSQDSTLLISLKKENLLEASVKINLENPRKAAEQLMFNASQPRIERLLSVVDEVNRFSVNELLRGEE